MRRRLSNLGILCSASVVGLLVLEVALRIALSVGFSDLSVSYRTNDQGFRERPFGSTPARHEKRILMLGDSFVFGQGVRDDATLPRQLEARGRELGLPRFEVWNVSRQGWNTRAEVDAALQLFEQHSFDAVLLVYTYNDIDLLAFEPTSASALWLVQKWLTAHIILSALHPLLNPYYANYWPTTESAYRNPESPELGQVAASFVELRDACAKRNLPLLVYYYELLVDGGDPRRDLGHDVIKALTNRLGIPFLAFPRLPMGTNIRKWHVHPLDPHPNARGHDRSARAIAQYLQTNPRFLARSN